MSVTLFEYLVGMCTVCGGDSATAHIHECSRASKPTAEGGCGGPWFCGDCTIHELCSDQACMVEHAGDDKQARIRRIDSGVVTSS
jgi:hypothetical protein